MDLACRKCGELVDLDELHDMGSYRQEEDLTFDAAWKLFAKDGCTAFGWKHSETPDKDVAAIMTFGIEILGDDVDGIASMLEDSHAGSGW